MPSHLFSMLARVGFEMACVEAARQRTEFAGRATAARRTFAVVDVVRNIFEALSGSGGEMWCQLMRRFPANLEAAAGRAVAVDV